ncbi:MAG: transposase [Chloroflexi bacterium]|nr:transposase [Chloroflexota bacterium]
MRSANPGVARARWALTKGSTADVRGPPCAGEDPARIPQRKRAEGHRPRRGRPQAPLGRTRRWVVERTFAWMDNCRRLVVRYERKLENFKAFCLVAFIQWSLNRLLRPVATIAPYY